MPPPTAPPREETQARVRDLQDILPPYVVLLHNDDHNDMLYVVQCVRKSVPGISQERAIEIMLEAHTNGKAAVTTCPLELAELYRDRLTSFNLTATIERV